MANMTWAGAVLWVPLVIGVPSLARATTPPPGFVLQETIQVPMTGSSVTSSTTLQSGVTYMIRASGSAVIGGPGFSDAEYAHDINNGQVQNNCFVPGFFDVDLGIGINDTDNDSSKFPFWGNFTSTHEYTISFVGLGAPISLNYHDCIYPDNSGSLTVEIFAPATPVPTLTG